MAKQGHTPPLLSRGTKLLTATEMRVPKVITSAMMIIAMNIFLFLLFSKIFKGIFITLILF